MVTIQKRIPIPLTAKTTTAIGEVYPGFSKTFGGESAGRYNTNFSLLCDQHSNVIQLLLLLWFHRDTK